MTSATPSRLRRLSVAGMIVLILLAVLRSSLATRLDGFTIDEAYHIAAGVSYVRTGDFRLNPEHPPLVKLVAGAALADDFVLPELRPLSDKSDERDFADTAVFLRNDPDRVQQRARIAMLGLHALLLLFFALAARRVLGDVLSLGALAFLVIDPTVSAHLPVVMTDLSVALLSATAALWAVAAFRTWKPRELMLASLFLGLTLAAKHSGLVTLAVLALLGLVLALVPSGLSRSRRLGSLALVLLGALGVLWAFYGFRFDESPAEGNVFNRPLEAKIGDVSSPVYRTALLAMTSGHLVPRSYVWGLADTIRSGVEGRSYPIYAFGRLYYKKGPFYFFPGVLLVKLPLGLVALALAGLFLFVARKVPEDWRLPLGVALGLAAVFLLVLASGSSYAGIRHAMPVVPVLALFGGAALAWAAESRSLPVRGLALLALGAAMISALPVLRPWEYYNELAGGAENAWRYFSDEGIGLGQRNHELVRYYEENLKASGERPLIAYPISFQEREARGLPKPRNFMEEAYDNGKTLTGTLFISASTLSPSFWWDLEALRETKPAARFGSLFVFRGTFDVAPFRSQSLFSGAVHLLNSPQPDLIEAERMLSKAVELNPKAFFIALELGNLLARRGARQEALRAYEVARASAPPDDEIIDLLTRQMERISREPPQSVPPLRNPVFE